MCSDENGAHHAIYYLNAQLGLCITQRSIASLSMLGHVAQRAVCPIGSPEPNYALVKYSAASLDGSFDVAFHATFGKPVLEFICGHNAVLHLTLDESRLVVGGVSTMYPGPLRVTYRIPFESRSIYGNNLLISEYESTINLLILDFKNSVLLSTFPHVSFGSGQLTRFLAGYLQLLQEAGNHVLFSPPKFGPYSPMMITDYALLDLSQAFFHNSIRGISVDQINTYLTSIWLKSSMLSYRGINGEKGNWPLRLLAQFNTRSYGQGTYGRFRMGLEPPTVEIVCDKELIMYFNIDELDCFDHNGVTQCSLTHLEPRYHDLKSHFPGLDEDDAFCGEQTELLVRFFTKEYLRLLKDVHYDVLYTHDTRWETVHKPLEHPSGGWEVGLPDHSRDSIRHTHMYGFDQVAALSHGSLDAHFASLRKSAHGILRQWTHDKFFDAKFKPLTVRLLSDNRAIVWVHLKGGILTTLREWVPSLESDATATFGEWRLAFEVPLKKCSQHELEGFDSVGYRNTMAFQKHGVVEDCELYHICLDLHNADYIHEYSLFADLTQDRQGIRHSVLKLQAAIHYVTQHYFPALCREAYHVLTSVPVWKPNATLPSSYALTSVDFQVYSSARVTRKNWAHVSVGHQPVLVVFGMTAHRAPPAHHLDWSASWVVQAEAARGFSHGTLSIARRVFMDERVLTLLARVNVLTTLVPQRADALEQHDFRGLQLVPWARHEQRKKWPAEWVIQPLADDGTLQYLWRHDERWQYDSRGNANPTNTSRGVSCVTRNYVELPTAVRQGALSIKIGGEVELSVSLQNTRTYTYGPASLPPLPLCSSPPSLHSARASVSWSTHVTVHTLGNTIRVDTVGSHDPVFTPATYAIGPDVVPFAELALSATLADPVMLLVEAFPPKVDLDGLVREMRAFEGAWQYCFPLAGAGAYALGSPIFNADGDLLFEFRRYGASSREGDGGRRLRQKRAPLAITNGSAPEWQLATPRIGVEVINERTDGPGVYNGNGNPTLKATAAAPEFSGYAPSELGVGDDSQASISVAE
ncbi:uncharacterized protein BXZ73DRAFT_77345 [Epithele typhae]|uniref:uncharacterized protein n=1 Tax=Epithele typhae TaxID=378194 RepID=UPI0020074D67|nr:uncharacterized protein BXZ73DRAFT_77345 [Epithele typhae]KAH9933183.1 hypothetical protein BXZ73DRAFT_77345 [Epithele typhae]